MDMSSFVPQLIRVRKESGSLYLRLPPSLISDLGIKQFDFLAVRIEDGEMRARRVGFEDVMAIGSGDRRGGRKK
jgi:antitoxin component of MazEF toxin-antitoxin module